VVFAGSDEVEKLIAAQIRAQPESSDPLHAAAAGLAFAADTVFEQYREAAVQRARIVAASAELQERDMVKRSTLADLIATVLRGRGTADQVAIVAAWSAVAAFHVALARWIDAAEPRPLSRLIEETLEQFLDGVGAEDVRKGP